MNGVETTAYWLVRVGGEFVVQSDSAPGSVFPHSDASAFADPDQALHIGAWQGKPCYAIEVDVLPHGIVGVPVPVRSVFGLAGEEAFALVCRAAQLLDWKKNQIGRAHV